MPKKEIKKKRKYFVVSEHDGPTSSSYLEKKEGAEQYRLTIVFKDAIAAPQTSIQVTIRKGNESVVFPTMGCNAVLSPHRLAWTFSLKGIKDVYDAVHIAFSTGKTGSPPQSHYHRFEEPVVI